MAFLPTDSRNDPGRIFQVIHSHPQLFHKRSPRKLAPDKRSRDPLYCQRFSSGLRVPLPSMV